MNKTISVWSGLGGTGKTSLALLIAESLERKGYKTCVYDSSQNKEATFLSSKNKFLTKVLTSPSDLNQNYQITIIDDQSYNFEDSFSNNLNPNLVIFPLRPNLLHVNNLALFNRNSMVNLFPIFNQSDFSRKEHFKILNNYNHFPKVKYRGIYERMFNLQTSIYHEDADNWAGIKHAREEIDNIASSILEKINR